MKYTRILFLQYTDINFVDSTDTYYADTQGAMLGGVLRYNNTNRSIKALSFEKFIKEVNYGVEEEGQRFQIVDYEGLQETLDLASFETDLSLTTAITHMLEE